MFVERFNVVLQGSTLAGRDVDTVATELARLIKRDTDFALRLLRGQPTTLKSGVDMVTGTRYLDALERVGAASRLEPETLEVDADLAAPPAAVHQGHMPEVAKVASAGFAERVQSEGDAVGSMHVRKKRSAAELATDAKPRSQVDSTSDQSDADAYYRAAVGARQENYYLDYFQRSDAADGLRPSWNWPAFLIGPAWLVYRKLWLEGIVWWLVLLVLSTVFWVSVLLVVINKGLQGASTAWSLATGLILFVASVVTGVYGNAYYHRVVKARIAKVRSRGLGTKAELANVASNGGTSVTGIIVVWGVFSVVLWAVIQLAHLKEQPERLANIQSAPSTVATAASRSTAARNVQKFGRHLR